MFAMLTRQRQGDLGEASAFEWLASKGAALFVRFGRSPDYDLIAELAGRLCRVQVKTSRYRTPNGTSSYQVQLETRGGNQSWSGTAKPFDPSRCDFVFVLLVDGRRWFIPSSAISARRAIAVGGVAYRSFEVEPGRPFAEDGPSPAALHSPVARWGTEAVKRGGL